MGKKRNNSSRFEPTPELLSQSEVALLLGITPKTLRNWREAGEGPPCYLVNGTRFRYALAEVQTWLEGQRVEPDRRRDS